LEAAKQDGGMRGLKGDGCHERRGWGWVGARRWPPPSRISSEEGDGVGWKETGPLHLAFRVREGDGWVGGRRQSPSVTQK